MSKTLDKMLELRVERALTQLNRAGAHLMNIKEGDRSIYVGATVCELLQLAHKHTREMQLVLLRIDRERMASRKAGRQ